MKRREFISRTAMGLGAAWLGTRAIAEALPVDVGQFKASDTVLLGKTGIRTSCLALGTGRVGSGHHSHQTALGIQGLADLLVNGYDRGLRFFVEYALDELVQLLEIVYRVVIQGCASPLLLVEKLTYGLHDSFSHFCRSSV